MICVGFTSHWRELKGFRTQMKLAGEILDKRRKDVQSAEMNDKGRCHEVKVTGHLTRPRFQTETGVPFFFCASMFCKSVTVNWKKSLNRFRSNLVTMSGTYRYKDLTSTFNFASFFASRPFLASFILRSWRWKWNVPPKRRLTYDGLHSVISQNT
jgi:hypothetical protein